MQSLDGGAMIRVGRGIGGTRSGLGGSAVVVGDEEGRGVRALVLEEVVVPCEGAAAALDGAGEGAVVRVDGTGVALQSSQRRD